MDSSISKQNNKRNSLLEHMKIPLKDPNFKTVIPLGGLIGIIPVIGGVFISGYLIEYLKRIVINNKKVELPKWTEDFKDIAKEGLYFTIASMIYSFIFIIMSVLLFLPFKGAFSKIYVRPDFFKLLTHGNNIGNLIHVSPETIIVLSIPIMVVLILLLFLVVLFPLLMIIYCKEGKFKGYFFIKKALIIFFSNFILYHKILGYLTPLWLIVLVISIPLFFLPIIGAIIIKLASFLASVISIFLLGKFYHLVFLDS